MKIENLLRKINKFSSLSIQESWDNSGIQVLTEDSNIDKILVTLDITEEVIDFAVSIKANLIISHHPLIFSGLKSINYRDNIGNIIVKSIKNNINIISLHTNIDKSKDGLADFFCKKLELINTKPLSSKYYSNIFKLVTFIPENFIDKFLNFFVENKVSVIGEYKACTFLSKGTGTFFPLKNSNPVLGEKCKLNKIKEFRVEIQITEDELNNIIDRIKNFHPYEEPVIDIYQLKQSGILKGSLGRIANLKESILLEDFIKIIKKTFNLNILKVITYDKNRKIKKIAVCPGSGMSLLKDVVKANVDVYITGDVKYHEALDANSYNLTVIDMGHFNSEIIFTELMKNFLENKCKVPVEIFNQKNIFKYL